MLLAEYLKAEGKPVSHQVDLEDLLEIHLGFQLDLDDLTTRLGTPDILGALSIDEVNSSTRA